MPNLLSMTGRKWILRSEEQRTPDILIDALKNERQLGPSSSPTSLSDPFLFPEMGKAVQRIQAGVQSKEIVGIFGDYDADGITAALQLVRFFRRHGIEPIVHLPDRVTEGYGMKTKSIDALHAKGVTLLITVDTGISAHAEIAHAKAHGIDVIVTDHHRPQGGRPDAFVIIHPMVPPGFPNPDLAGAGVAFTLVRALEDGKPWHGIEEDVVLATIGTVGDLVPLTGENRLLVIKGLRCAARLRPSPLKELINAVQGKKPLTSTDIAFRIVPRINASGRMAHPDIALHALLDGGEALEQLHRLNEGRQELVGELMVVASGLVDPASPFLCVIDDRFTPGTVGLIASRLTEEYGRPTLAGSVRGDDVVASLRSVDGVDLFDCLTHPSVRPLLSTCGGHAMAAGCTLKRSAVSDLRSALNVLLIDRGITAASLIPTLHLDASIAHGDLSPVFAEALETLAPFGQGNEEPVFLLPKRKLTDVRTVGADNRHLQCRIGGIKGIGFGLGHLMQEIAGVADVDVACRVGINEWNGRREVQVFVEDVKKSA
ncbi:MAG: single-stranded-DNA-specific exonuclease RecJ [Candidatus Peribacteraceae bacterium]|nr:single-stranded-DNA-specific exonuclease RecJ [Candidatus Peribacteraceae bacterium]